MKKENHPKLLKKEISKVRTQNPLVIIVVRKDILLMCAGARMQISMTNLKTWVIVHKCNKQGHQAHDWKTRTIRTPRFEGYYYNYQKYGHKAFECKSKSMWSPNRSIKVRSHGHSYNWDYQTRQSYHYCQECGHIPENCIRTHFRGNYNKWLSQITCFSYLKIGHISKHFPTRSKAPNSKFNKEKGKVDVEHIRGEINKTWKKRDGSSAPNGGITSPNRSSGHISSN